MNEGDPYAFEGSYGKTINDAVKVPYAYRHAASCWKYGKLKAFLEMENCAQRVMKRITERNSMARITSLTARETHALDKMGGKASPYKIDNLYKRVYTAGLAVSIPWKRI